MGKTRLEAFSDGVLAIVITIMVLELKVPHGDSLMQLQPLLQVTQQVSGGVLWANLHLLFWLSLVPFATAWMGENRFAAAPVALYGVVLLMASIAYWILEQVIIAKHGGDSVLAYAIGNETKGKVSILLYAIAVPVAFVAQWVAGALYILVALMWLIPDRRIEHAIIERVDRTETDA